MKKTNIKELIFFGRKVGGELRTQKGVCNG